MNEYALRDKLKQQFSLENWKEIIEASFPACTFYGVPDKVDFTRDAQEELAEHIHHIGEVRLSDGNTMAFIDVQLQKGATRLIQNRVGLRKLVDSEVVAGVREGAIIVYHQPDYAEWRISFYSETYDWDEKEGLIKEETHPKRYTFVVGGDETCRTAAERLHSLAGSVSALAIDDVMEAFSVEKVSKYFFEEYKHQYDKFVEHLTGEAWTKDGKQEVGEPIGQLNHFFKTRPGADPKKEARDFVKKLLGRIVFLYFVQKKGWLGAESDEFKDGKPNFIRNLFGQYADHTQDENQFYSQWLRQLFFTGLNVKEPLTFTMPNGSTAYIPYLNGGLFDEDEIDQKLEGFTLPDTLFHHPEFKDDPEDRYDRENKRGFLDFLDAFNFTIHEDSPEDQTIGVDPEMLGHIFENLLEDNKEKGAYYTPKPIVHYMCQESLIEYLNTELNGDDELREKIEELIKKQETAGVDHVFEKILNALKTVKVCDPAIGSGAFPMGILQEIFQTVETIFYASRDDVDATWGLVNGELSAANIKKQIIQNSIYGVDIEKGAVDIAKLRFWLSLIVDEEKPSALPNLEYKIVTGNSLISTLSLNNKNKLVEINWNLEGKVKSTRQYLKDLEEILRTTINKQKEFFNTDKEHGKALKEEIETLKIEALITQIKFDQHYYKEMNPPKGGGLPSAQDKEYNLNRDITISEYSDAIKKLKAAKKDVEIDFNHFDWKLDFPEILNPIINGGSNGFDIIIANPPYISHDKIENKSVIKSKYDVYEPFADVYCYFIELSENILKETGHLCYITSNSFLRTNYGKPLRNFLAKNTTIIDLINIEDSQIFSDAIVNVSILLAQKGKLSDHEATVFNNALRDNITFDKQIENNSFRYPQASFGKDNSWTLLPPSHLKILDLIKNQTKTLEELNTNIRLGIATGYNKAFVIDEKQKDKLISADEKNANIIKPVLRGRNISRYHYDSDEYIILSKNGIDIPENYPTIFDYLDNFGEKFKKRGAQGKHWTNLRACSFFDDFKKEKIIWIELTDRGRFTISDEEIYLLNSAYFMLPPKNIPPKYLLAVLNSRVIQFFMECIAESSGMGTLRWIKNNVKNFPIKINVNTTHFEILVDYILYMKSKDFKKSKDKLISAFFEQILDGMVYDLYFPELLDRYDRKIITHIHDLPKIPDGMTNDEKLKICRDIFRRFNDKSHPLRNNLFYLDSIPEIAIMEGNHENN